MLITFVIAYILLAVILVQDVRSRTIWWFLPPLLFADLLWLQWEQLSWLSLGFNLLFIAGMLAFLTIYIAIRFGNPMDLFKRYFGLGDVLFLLAITPLCGLRPFIILFTAGTIFTLLLFGVGQLIKKRTTIPYAGYFSLTLLVYLSLLQSGTDVLTYLPIE